ncbi:MAG: nitrilase-related carbon-nitrogen hydrolase [Candidatus Sumerlaeaceae bacterium]
MTRIGFVQYNPVFGQRVANFKTIERFVATASHPDLLVLPELAAVGYEFRDSGEVAQFAEAAGAGPTTDLLRSLAAEYRTTIVMGYPERERHKLYNSCMMIQPDGTITNYRKMHLFSRENELFSPGDAAPPVVQTSFGRVGLMICFDWFFPEVARLLTLGGAQVIAHPCNLILDHCQRAMYARSVENGIFSITANRFGTEERAGRKLTFTGASQILDPKGNCLASGPVDSEYMQVVEVNLDSADNKQINAHNHLLKSRRVELFSGLLNNK